MSNNTKSLTVFLDNIGRTILGKQTNQTEEILSIENPALVHIQANNQSGQLQLQILPLFFKEFQSDRNASTVWNFKKNSITLADEIPFAPQFIAQYEQLFQVTPIQSQPQGEPKVVKLFDE